MRLVYTIYGHCLPESEMILFGHLSTRAKRSRNLLRATGIDIDLPLCSPREQS